VTQKDLRLAQMLKLLLLTISVSAEPEHKKLRATMVKVTFLQTL